MKRISNNLFEEIRKVTIGESVQEQSSIDEAKKMKSESEDEKEDDDKEEKKEKMSEGNDGNLANNYPPYDKVTKGDVIAGRLGKDHMGGKAKKKMAEDFEFTEEELDQAVLQEDQMETVLDEEISQMVEKYMGFSKTVSALKARGAKKPAALAAWIGRKKYGKAKFQKAAAQGKSLRGESTEIEEASKTTRSTGTAFDWKGKSSSIMGDEKSQFKKKKISTGTVYSRKYDDETKKKMKESITQTIINHDGYVLEVTNNPTFKDYFNALQTLVPESSEEIRQDIVAIATEAHKEQYTDVLVQAEAKKMFKKKMMEHKNVLDENYIVEQDEVYVEYVVEQDGKFVQYVHTGKVVLK